jgi:hypothetical protein
VFGIVPSVPATAPHESEFADLRRELEEIVSKLKTTRDGEAKETATSCNAALASDGGA